MIITRTPYRMSFFGGGTDHKEWYSRHGARILSVTMDKYCYVCARRMPPFLGSKYRLMWSKMENVNERAAIEHAGIRGCLEYLGIDDGIEVNHAGDLPARTGLGSSSAFTISMLHALYELTGRLRSKRELACDAIQVEQVVLKESVGIQDQIECAHGGLNWIEIEPDGSWSVQPVLLHLRRVKEFEAHLMLFYTGLVRNSSQIAAATIEAIDSGAKDPELHHLAGMAQSAKDILTRDGDLAQLGEMMNRSWAIKRRMSPLVTNAEIDAMYESARHAGAIGGKLLGAGGGGFMLLVVRPDDHGRVRGALKGYIDIPVRFEFGGAQMVHSG